MAAKKTVSSPLKILQESECYAEWAHHDSTFMTWLNASMMITYQNKVVRCNIFAESWDTINYIFTVSSRTRIQSLKTQLRATKKTGTISEYLQSISKLVDSLHSIAESFLRAYEDLINKKEKTTAMAHLV
ncbi:hypothetical protein PIB30_013302 [Stylosanthes scabra]|uniref:Retrotransposon gag domain-containing protein n=1 Tax=Stylosanthes scabra TaxID=79078 RepID=A0ABU6T8D9_9FABA|nr:hypothetical protein [Stylosanthes scabra]